MMNNERFEERCISYLYDEMSDEERREFQNLLATDRNCYLKYNAIRKAKMMLGNLPRVEPGGEVRVERSERPAQSVSSTEKTTGTFPESSAVNLDETSPGTSSERPADKSTTQAAQAGRTAQPDPETAAQSRLTGTPKSYGPAKHSSAGAKAPPRSTSTSTSSTPHPALGIFPGSLTGRVISAAAAILFGIIIFGAITGLQIRWDDSGFAMSMSLFGADREPEPPVYLLQDETLEQLRVQQERLFSEILAAEREQQRVMLLETLSEYAEAIETRRMIDMQLIGMELADFQQQTNQQLSQTDRVIYQIIETLSYQQEQHEQQDE